MASVEVTMLVTLISLFLFLVLGVPIAFSLAFSGILGVFLYQGPMGLAALGSVPFQQLNSFSLLAVPMFILMGNILAKSGLAEVVLDSTHKLIGHLKGGLAMTATVAGALFGFVCGSSSASAATIGGVLLPEMEKRGYDRKLAVGTLASAGTLAILIPPSVIMIIYCIISETSMGDVFVAGIFPGLILAFLMMLYIYIRVLINPRLAPVATGRVDVGERAKALLGVFPVLILFLGIIGSIYKGICSATEAGAIGVFLAAVICLAYRKFSWKIAKEAALHTVNTCVMIYMLIIGGNILAYVFYVTGIQAAIGKFVVALALPGWFIIIVMAIILMIGGCFLDVIALLTIFVPIFLPIAELAGFSPVWFGIFIVLFSEMALITPPVGLNLFIIQGIAPKGTTLGEVGLGALPYIGIIWLLLGLLLTFPEIALYLPATMVR